MKSEVILRLLSSLKTANITDSHVITNLQNIRTNAMATKGGVQRLIQLACVPEVLTLLYKYTAMDKSETEEEKASSERTISVALSIIANLLTDKNARLQVKRHGIEVLVTLLTDCSSEEVKIRCCRALSNLAIDLPVRAVMAQAKAVPALVKALEIHYIEVKKPKDPETSCDKQKDAAAEDEDCDLEPKFPSLALVENACRALRYLFCDCKVRLQFVEEGVVKALSRLVKSEESKLTACVLRALSELWTKMNKRITERMANEVSWAGIVPKLLELIDSEEDKISQQAFVIVLPLAGHPHSAAVIGASDGVNFFLSHLDSSREHVCHKELISALCQLAKEAVNRVKLRVAGGLKVLLETLQNDALAAVHDRVISCLVSFLYDDAGLTKLVEDGLVNILLHHLQCAGNYTSDLSVNLGKRAEAFLHSVENSHVGNTLEKDISNDSNLPGHLFEGSETVFCSIEEAVMTDIEMLPENSRGNQSVSKSAKRVLRSLAEDAVSELAGGTHTCKQSLSSEEFSEAQNLSSQANMDEERGNAVVDLTEEGDESEDTFETSHVQTYSMHSPSYQAETTWHMDNYNPGVTCKSYNTNLSPHSAATYSEDSGPLSSDQYSPLSIPSYFSPSHSSTASSPAYSSAALSPVHSPGKSPSEAGSEASSPFSPHVHTGSPLWDGSSSPLSSFHTAVEGTILIFSSSEDEDCVEDTQPGISRTNTADVDVLSAAKHSVPSTGDRTASDDLGPSINKEKTLFPQSPSDFGDTSSHLETALQFSAEKKTAGKRIFKLYDSSDESQEVVKKRKEGSKPGIHASVTQHNILIVLARLSVHEELIQHLATPNVLLCLTDYLALAHEPLDRCFRVLLRIMNSLHCFTHLLKICAPAIIVRTLMLDSDLKLILHETLNMDERGLTSSSQVSRQVSVDGLDMRSLMTMSSGTSKQMSTETRLLGNRLNRSASLAEKTMSSSKNPGKRSDRKWSCDSENPSLNETSSNPHTSLEWKRLSDQPSNLGARLLQTMSYQGMSPYAGGEIYYTLHRLSPAHRLLCSASLLFLQTHWSRERRQDFLFKEGAVETVLSALCTQHTDDQSIKDVLVLGLVYMAQGLNIPPKFQSKDTQPLLEQALKAFMSGTSAQESVDTTEARCDGEICRYSRIEKDLQIVVQGSACEKLEANRQMLIRNSTVFSAMLQGSYLESTQSEIGISDTCFDAMRSLLHYLHGCGDQCPVLNALYNCEHAEVICHDLLNSNSDSSPHPEMFDSQTAGNHPRKEKRLKHLLDLIALADRFLFSEFVQYLCAVVSTTLVDGNSAKEIFCFASFHRLSDLAEDCMQALLLSPCSMAEKASCVVSLAEGKFGCEVAASILSLLKTGVENTS